MENVTRDKIRNWDKMSKLTILTVSRFSSRGLRLYLRELSELAVNYVRRNFKGSIFQRGVTKQMLWQLYNNRMKSYLQLHRKDRKGEYMNKYIRGQEGKK